jgi:hypothetical protein
MKLKASTRLLADSPVIAPSDSFRDENKEQLKDRQSESRKTEKTDTGSPSAEASSTAVSQGSQALPQTESTYARLIQSGAEDDPLTMDMEDACTAGDTSDGYVPNSETGFELEGPDVDENYLNVRGCSTEDELLADADPTLWNNAEQPMG